MNKYNLICKEVKKHKYSVSPYLMSLFAICDIAISIGSPNLRDRASKALDVCAGELFADGAVSFGNQQLLLDVNELLISEFGTYGLELRSISIPT